MKQLKLIVRRNKMYWFCLFVEGRWQTILLQERNNIPLTNSYKVSYVVGVLFEKIHVKGISELSNYLTIAFHYTHDKVTVEFVFLCFIFISSKIIKIGQRSSSVLLLRTAGKVFGAM